MPSPIAQAHDRDAASSPRGHLACRDEGIAKIDDTAAGRQWQIDELACEVTVPRDSTTALAVTASGRVTPGEPAGQFSLRLKFEPGSALPRLPTQIRPPLGTGQGEIAVTSQALPLELFEPLVAPPDAGSELAGMLDTNITAQWNDTAAQRPAARIGRPDQCGALNLVGPWPEKTGCG